jgi:hypothetical protein
MDLFRSLKFSITASLLILITSCSNTSKKELLLGDWAFYKFEFNGPLADIPEKEEKKANEMNRELIISFLHDEKYVSKQKGGMEENNSEGKYKLLDDGRLFLISDTLSIIQLDKTFLKLYIDDLTPVAIFKRIQNDNTGF